MPSRPRSRPRLALFTHDAFGLGHVRRSVHVIRAIAEREPRASILLVTGSPATHLLDELPPGADHVKIPTIVTSGVAGTTPSVLDIGVAEIAALRAQVTRQVLESFEPDAFLVDNFPLGTRLELLPALRAMRHRPTRTALGLRDVVDPPEKVRKDWSRDGLYEVIDRYYDRILVYGVPEILDAAEAYELPASAAERVRYCGYVVGADPPRRTVEEIRHELDAPDGFLLATVGGGGDGRPLIEAFLDAVDSLGSHRALVVAGEFMSDEDRAAVRARAGRSERVVFRHHVSDLPAYMTAASAVTCMGGYNTCAEVVSVGVPAVVVPRTWRSGEHSARGTTGVDAEQLVRARALDALGVVKLLHPDQLAGASLAEAIRTVLAAPPGGPPATLSLDGAGRVAEQLLDLCRDAD